MLTAGMATKLGGGQASSLNKPAAGVQVDHQADSQAAPANRLEQTPKQICAGGDVFSLGEAPADTSEKGTIQDFVRNHRSDTHREFQMELMPLSDADINLLMKFQQLINISKTAGGRKYFLVQVMYEISQRYWTLGEVKASYISLGAKNFLAQLRKKVVRPLRPAKDTSDEDLREMRDIGILAMRIEAYGDNVLCQINKTSKLVSRQ